jgi:tRNA pseudouridine13 synthase
MRSRNTIGFDTEWATVSDPTFLDLLFFSLEQREAASGYNSSSMKLKQQPEDFQVEEHTTVSPGTGAHAFYRLDKRGWSTLDALAAVRRRWKIDLRRLSCGGMKDRHARTVQYFTIFHGPKRNLTHQEVHVKYLGQVAAPYTSTDILANAFTITLREVASAEGERIRATVGEMSRDGVPNYFDDQRFGSVVHQSPHLHRDDDADSVSREPQAAEQEFIARLLVLGRFEDALRLALTGPYQHDRAEEKREKAILREHWGDWKTLKERLEMSHVRNLVMYLVDRPTDFRGAMVRLRPELRGLYLSAYQSHLWNRMLARWLTQHCGPEQLVPIQLRLGDVPFHRQLDAEQRAELTMLQLPLPSARLKLPPDDPRLPLAEAVLAEEGLELKQMQVKGVRELFFSKGERAALCMPVGLRCEMAADELHPGQHKAVLSFELPRGSYATLIVKRVQQSD